MCRLKKKIFDSLQSLSYLILILEVDPEIEFSQPFSTIPQENVIPFAPGPLGPLNDKVKYRKPAG